LQLAVLVWVDYILLVFRKKVRFVVWWERIGLLDKTGNITFRAVICDGKCKK